MVQQLTIFDVAPKKEAFAVGDMVEFVVNVDEKNVEDYYYLQDFAGLKGQVIRVLRGLQYEVYFEKKDRVGVFRHSELRRGERDD